MKRATILLSLCTLLLGAAIVKSAGFRIRYRTVGGTKYLFLRDIATFYGMSYAQGSKIATLNSRFSELRFTLGKRESVLNGIKAHLSFAPTVSGGEAMLSLSDFKLLLDPLMRPQILPQKRVAKIMIDPGHGGKDHGTRGRRYYEKTITLQVARRAAAALRQRGFQVALTRDRDRYLTLDQRARLCAKWGADLFISIHANYVNSSSVQGIETYMVSPRGTASTYSDTCGSSTCTNDRFDKEDARLAYEVQKRLIHDTGADDRGIKHARFVVLRKADCPAILIETGFLSNPTEERRLGSSAYQEEIAKGISEGVARYASSLKSKH